METVTDKKTNKVVGRNHELIENGVLDENQLVGRWKLMYEITNSLKTHGFGSVTLEPYMHPQTRNWCYPVVDGQPKIMIEITAAETVYDPDTNFNHRSIVNWMLNHPDVRIDGMKLDEKIMLAKNENSKFRLFNVDRRDLTEFEEENVIDEMVGRLTLTSGPHAIGLQKIRWVLAKLNEPWQDRRIMANPKAEKLILQNKLKSYVKKSKDNAVQVRGILDNLEDAKKNYCIKLLINNGDIKVVNGMLKYKSFVLGMNVDSAVHYLEQDQETYLDIQDKAGEILKQSDDQ